MRYTLILFFIIFYSCGNDDDIRSIIVENPIENPVVTNENGDLFGRIPCTNGFADIYPCDGYDLLSRISIVSLESSGGNDIWGWTDPLDNSEYAIVGTRQGTVFINISNPENPEIVGTLLTATETSIWRDIKVYNNYAFIVSEAANHGMQIFDLTRLRDLDGINQNFDADAQYNEWDNAHNIVINEESGYAYGVGTNTFSGGAHFVNIQDPLNPIAEGGYAASGYTHDAQVVTYAGPDTDYQGHELFLGSNEDEVVIVDVSDKSNPTLISSVSYPDVGYTHQGWLSDDHRYFYANDELDESNFGFESRTLIFDLNDLDNPFFVNSFFGPTQAIDHNLYVHGNELFLSNYSFGVRIADITEKESPIDIGFFDSFPANNNTGFNGVWSIYPFFPSGNIIVNDVNNGLFIIRKTGT